MKLLRIAVLLAGPLLLLGSADADEVSKTVRAGQSTYVGRILSWNADCTYRSFEVEVTPRPQHGSVDARFGTEIIGAEPNSADANRAAPLTGGSYGACRGKPVRGAQLYYKPASGFKGTDSFGVTATLGSGKYEKTYIIEVK
jgi:hypothetical protein